MHGKSNEMDIEYSTTEQYQESRLNRADGCVVYRGVRSQPG